jgi:hypothetical protein
MSDNFELCGNKLSAYDSQGRERYTLCAMKQIQLNDLHLCSHMQIGETVKEALLLCGAIHVGCGS